MKYKQFFSHILYEGYPWGGFDVTQREADIYNTNRPAPVTEGKPCWKGYVQYGMKLKNGKKVPNCIPIKTEHQLTDDIEHIHETDEYCPQCIAEVLRGQHPEQLGEGVYQGRKVPLGKPMRGDVKKFKVFVKDPKTGNIKKVNFGDKTMKIKKSNPKRRKSFRARHHCDTNPGPRTKARYWSCKKW
jgi:hypothetical protein